MLVSTRRKPVAYHIVIYHGHQIENGAHSLVDVLKIHIMDIAWHSVTDTHVPNYIKRIFVRIIITPGAVTRR